VSKVHQPNNTTIYRAILAIGTITFADFQKAFPNLPSPEEPELRKGDYVYPRIQTVGADLIHLEGAEWAPGEIQVPHYTGPAEDAHKYVDPYDGRVAQAAFKRNVCMRDTRLMGVDAVFFKGEWYSSVDDQGNTTDENFDAVVRTLVAEASWNDLFSTYECISTKRENLRGIRVNGWQNYLLSQDDLDKVQKGS
jgi:hypothetical protein